MRVLPYQLPTYPTEPGVYRMLNAWGQIIYIGKAKNLRNRLSNYFDNSAKSARIAQMVKEIQAIEITTTASENDALVLEQKLINKIKPKYNIIFRDDKSYPFIALSTGKFPRIFISRQKDTRQINENLFGPYPQRANAHRAQEFVQKTFKIRTCSDNEFSYRSRPCMLHDIGKCSAPCMKKDDAVFMKQYEDSVSNAKEVLAGNIGSTVEELKQKMSLASQGLEFERAASLRDTIKSLENIADKQNIFSLGQENAFVFNYLLSGKDAWLGYSHIAQGVPQELIHMRIKVNSDDLEETFKAYVAHVMVNHLNHKLIIPGVSSELSQQEESWLVFVENNLKNIAQLEQDKELQRGELEKMLANMFVVASRSLSIDGIDISHFSTEATYGSKVRWLKHQFTGKAVLAIEEAVNDDVRHIGMSVKQLYSSAKQLPSILLIDGDIPQMQAAFQALSENGLEKDVLLLCSAKGVSRKKGEETFHVHPQSQHKVNKEFVHRGILKLPRNHPVRLLLQNIQDHAHEHANAARKKQMSQVRFNGK